MTMVDSCDTKLPNSRKLLKISEVKRWSSGFDCLIFKRPGPFLYTLLPIGTAQFQSQPLTLTVNLRVSPS